MTVSDKEEILQRIWPCRSHWLNCIGPEMTINVNCLSCHAVRTLCLIYVHTGPQSNITINYVRCAIAVIFLNANFVHKTPKQVQKSPKRSWKLTWNRFPPKQNGACYVWLPMYGWLWSSITYTTLSLPNWRIHTWFYFQSYGTLYTCYILYLISGQALKTT